MRFLARLALAFVLVAGPLLLVDSLSRSDLPVRSTDPEAPIWLADEGVMQYGLRNFGVVKVVDPDSAKVTQRRHVAGLLPIVWIELEVAYPNAHFSITDRGCSNGGIRVNGEVLRGSEIVVGPDGSVAVLDLRPGAIREFTELLDH